MSRLPTLAPRAADAHKGDFGRVLVLAGSRGMVGAAELCTNAALRAGAGLVVAATPQECYPMLAAKLTCGMTRPQSQTPSGGFSLGGWRQIAALAKEFDVVAFGPGIGRHASTQALVMRLVGQIERPMVLDADALFALAEQPERLQAARAGCVVTPHAGEMARLVGRPASEVQAHRETTAAWLAKATGCVVVLKGHGSVVTDGERIEINRTGNPGMATAGAGDVLTGMIAALIGQGLGLFDAARLGAHLHGLAGDIAAERLGQVSLTASDILEAIPDAMKQEAQRHGGTEAQRAREG